MTTLKIVLTTVYWLLAAVILWLGYEGDAEIDRLSATPVTHSAAFDTALGFGVALVVYLLAAAVWWISAKIARSTAGPANTKA